MRAQLDLRFLQKALQELNASLQQKVEEQVREISEAQLILITAMTKLVEARDDATGGHIERTRRLCRFVAESLRAKPEYRGSVDEDFIENIYNASPLHDIGKVAIKDSILLKPGKLLPEEFEEMKKHTTIGKEYLGRALEKSPGNKYLKIGMEIAGNHHEKWDGSGYPAGLSGQAIPLSARVMALVDVYDALRSKRVYKDCFSQEKTVSIITEGKGRHFDPGLVEVFLENEKEFDRLWSLSD